MSPKTTLIGSESNGRAYFLVEGIGMRSLKEISEEDSGAWRSAETSAGFISEANQKFNAYQTSRCQLFRDPDKCGRVE